MHRDALMIFIKNPLAGKVKTRLAATIGDDRALHIYQRLLHITRNLTIQADCTRYLFYSDFIETGDDWPESSYGKLLQQGNDLGKRMSNAFAEVLKYHSKALIMGSDCPELSADILREAFSKLDHCDFVIGPAADGGYYLLGMKEYSPEIFEGIEWSSPEVLDKTVQKISDIGKTIAFCPTLRDLDDESDWEKLKHIIEAV